MKRRKVGSMEEKWVQYTPVLGDQSCPDMKYLPFLKIFFLRKITLVKAFYVFYFYLTQNKC